VKSLTSFYSVFGFYFGSTCHCISSITDMPHRCIVRRYFISPIGLAMEGGTRGGNSNL